MLYLNLTVHRPKKLKLTLSIECSDWLSEEPNCKLWDSEPKGDVTGGDKFDKPLSCTSLLQGIFTGAEAPNKPIIEKN